MNNAQQTREVSESRYAISSALSDAVEILTSHREEVFDDVISNGLRPIADAAGLDRIAVYRLLEGNGRLGQMYVWKHGKSAPLDVELIEAPNNPPIIRWLKTLMKGECIHGRLDFMAGDEAAFLGSFGIRSAFFVPIFTHNEFWGMVVLEDHTRYRHFDEDCLDLLCAAARLCANAFISAEMERKLIDANGLNHAILNADPMGFTAFDEDLRTFDCNDSIVELFGTTKEYYIEHFLDFSPEYQSDGSRSREKAIELIKGALAGKKQAFEWTHISSSGELMPFEVTLTRAKYNGKYMVLGYQYDLRNIKKMMKNINEQSELLKLRLEQQELISDISRGFISSGDSKTHIKEAITKLGRYHNVSMVYIFGIDYQHNDTYMAYNWTTDNVPPRVIDFDFFGYVNSRFPETLPESATVPIISCADTTASTDEVCAALLSIGVTSFICAPLYVEGRLWGVMSVEQCFGPRQWTDNEKKFVAITASTIAGVIMRNLYNTMLKDALHKATEASKAKGEFLSNMSHEMRTPLNAIIGMTTIGKNAASIERKDYALGKISDASTHLLGVINDVLDMSKIEANMLELSPVEFNFEKMLQKVVAVVNFRVDEKRQKLTVHIDKEIPPTLIADDQRLAQVITNLLGNAVKFTPEDGLINLDARFLEEENGLCSIQVSVSDTGIGISPEQQKRLFSSFQQAESSITRKYGGTGLGLAISKSIVEMMGGTIKVHSESGKGSTFTITIQARRGAEEKQEFPAPNVDLSDVRIMAIDDDPDILEYFKEVARGLGVHCDTAINGEEALRLVDSGGAYHIYFTDWKMPGIDGIQLAHELKTRASVNADSFVIMISAAELNTAEKEAKEAGVDRFLSKPLFPSAIAAAINESLGVKRQQTQKTQTDIAGIFEGRSILLAEDVEINREIVKTVLEPTRIEIDYAENGVEAVRMFTETPNKYSIVFMDVQMPEMDGYEATRRIRAFEAELPPEHPQRVPIIAMTANVFREDIEKCLEAGMDSHVGKPLDFDEVLGKLRAYLR